MVQKMIQKVYLVYPANYDYMSKPRCPYVLFCSGGHPETPLPEGVSFSHQLAILSHNLRRLSVAFWNLKYPGMGFEPAFPATITSPSMTNPEPLYR
jgi:hypothetical protein